jgi:DNA-binding NarL/FixJ family response regulator
VILLADHEPSMASMLKSLPYLKRTPVQWVTSVGQAMRAARCQAPRIALVNMQFASGSGAELIPLLHEGWPGLPVVATSNLPDASVERLAYRLGVTAYLPKPIYPNLLADVIVSIHRHLIRTGERLNAV